MRVDEVGGEVAAQPAQRERQRRRRPRAPVRVRAPARRGEERHVGDVEAVELGAQRLAQRRGQLAGIAAGERRLRRHRPVEDEHADLGARVARGERLAVGPDAEHRIGGARVVLGDDGDLHAAAPVAAATVG